MDKGNCTTSLYHHPERQSSISTLICRFAGEQVTVESRASIGFGERTQLTLVDRDRRA
jgi:hypothetical protein